MDQKKVGVAPIVIGIIVLLGIGGAAFAYTNSKRADSMMKEDAAMKAKEAMVASTTDSMQATSSDSMKKSDAMMKDETSMNTGDAMMAKGSYQAYSPEKLALAKSGHVVLFFHASWCPTCRALDADIKAMVSSIPSGLTILDVDYDKSAALKQKYGVTTQHTLVEVAADGTLIKKWTGSPTLAMLVANVK